MKGHVQKRHFWSGVLISCLLAGVLLVHSLQVLSASQLAASEEWGETAVAPAHTLTASSGITPPVTSTLYLPIIFSPPPAIALQPIQAVCATNSWTLTWDDGGPNVQAYELQESHLSTFDQPVTITLTETQYVASPPLSPDHLYYYRVRALALSGVGPWSETQSIIGSFLDTFDDPNSGWPKVSDSNYTFGYINGEYEITTQQAGAVYRPISPNYFLNTYTVEADVHWQGTATDGLYGILFGVVQDVSQYYLFSIYPSTQQYRLLRRAADGSFVELVPRTTAANILTGNGVNHLAAAWDNGQITLSINGVAVESLTNTAITGLTGAGVGMSPNPAHPAAAVRFDNFQVLGCKTPADSSNTPATTPFRAQPPLLTFDTWIEE
ncbi:MAG: hypothetical protein H6660_08300 [Ardenticatenaceae bacterium]|nr:hypothetical protein [Ardenticatenaceae bacterium]